MTIKSVLLAAVAAAAVTPAFAADPATPAAAPVAANYVKVCDTFGAGYFNIPGGDTCIKISGRVRANAYYKTSSSSTKGYAYTDGRVEFATAQTTDIGVAKSALRFDYNGKNGSAVKAGEAWVSVGDFQAGYNMGEQHEFADFGGYGEDDQGVNPLWAANQSSARLNEDDNGIGVRWSHDFGGGLSGGIEAVGGDATSYQFAPHSTTSNPVIEAEAVYAVGQATFSLGGSYDTAQKISDTQGGYGVVGQVEYAFSDAFKAGLGLAYTRFGTDPGQFHVQIGGQYDVTKKVQLYANALISTQPSGLSADENKLTAEAGIQYTVAPKLYVIAEEDYSQTAASGSTSWTTLLRLKRKF